MTKDSSWFKTEVAPLLKGYEIQYKSFAEGDLGSLDQAEFNSEKMGGVIDYWGSGWLGIHLVDYVEGNELLNVLLKPNQELEKEKAFQDLQNLLGLQR